MNENANVVNVKKIEWVLRVALFGIFLGHGVLALQIKPSFLSMIEGMSGISGPLAENLLVSIGVIDIITAILAIIYPLRLLLMWAITWGFLTGLARPVSGEPVWDFIERWGNWAIPLALLYLKGLPINFKMLFKL